MYSLIRNQSSLRPSNEKQTYNRIQLKMNSNVACTSAFIPNTKAWNHYLSLVTRKPAFCICENKDADQLRGNRKLISAFVFATRIVQSLFYLDMKFQGSSHLLRLYSLVCVRPGRKPRRPVFSERGSFALHEHIHARKASTENQIRNCTSHMSLIVRKPVFGVSDKVRHKPGCKATEDG